MPHTRSRAETQTGRALECLCVADHPLQFPAGLCLAWTGAVDFAPDPVTQPSGATRSLFCLSSEKRGLGLRRFDSPDRAAREDT